MASGIALYTMFQGSIQRFKDGKNRLHDRPVLCPNDFYELTIRYAGLDACYAVEMYSHPAKD
jgi:hypothetical protein